MKTLKTFSIIGIVLSSFGLLGSLGIMGEGDEYGIIAFVVYGYFLTQSIIALNITKK